ncbi:TPA: HNH endonuclease [Serratia fonticola]
MFNVIRTMPAPECLSRKIYNDSSVTEALRKIFHDKCYLCERSNLADPEIEHLIPHESKDEKLKYGWHNLFYSCSRCNSIKGSNHKGITDCTDTSLSVFDELSHLMPSVVDEPVKIGIEIPAPWPDRVTKTALLLNECFNLNNTGLRGITRENLLEELFDHYYYFLGCRKTLIDNRSTDAQIDDAKDKLKTMCKVKYPFSVFWKWHIIKDSRLNFLHPDIVNACKAP